MRRVLVWWVLFPVLCLVVTTVAGAWLEVNRPEYASYASVSLLTLLWLLFVPTLLLKRGLSLPQGMFCGVMFLLPSRITVAAIYALAWASEWRIKGSDEPVRYVQQTFERTPEATPLDVFLANALVPTAFGLGLMLVVWILTWAIVFRDRRGLVRRVRTRPSDA